MLNEFASGIAINLLSDATSRGFGAFVKSERHKATVRRILLQGATSADSSVSDAIALLVQVLGSGVGQYTTAVAAILSDFSSSQLAAGLVLSIRTGGRHLPSIRAEFVDMYGERLKATSIDSGRFFDALCHSLNAILWSKYVDPHLAALTTEHHQEIIDHLDAVALAIRSAATLPPMDGGAFDAISAKVCRAAVGQTRTIAVETSRGQKRVAISTHFVKSRLSRMMADDFFDDVVSVQDNTERTITYASFVGSFHRAVVLGTPGGGKSTLCQYICHDLAQRVLAAQKHPTHGKHDPAMIRTPLVVVLRRYEKYNQDTNLSVIDFIVDELSHSIDDDTTIIATWLRKGLAQGRIVILFDGLDEILEVAARRRFVRLVEAFVDAWPAAPMLATSRKVGYAKAPLRDDFVPFQLAPFNRDEIRSYASKLIALEQMLKKDEATALADDFYSQTESNASDLRRNPLMLGLMVWLFCVQGEVPSHRAEIYKQCSDLMFDRWDKNRGIRAAVPDDFDLVSLFSFLASKIFGRAQLEDGVTAEWLEQVAFQFFRAWYEENAKARSAAKAIQEFITGRAWVMTDVGAGIYKFTHRTFLEYFFSRNILSLHDTAKSLIGALRPKIVAAQWDVINHLCIQAFCYKDARRSSQVTHLLTEIVDSTAIGEKKINATYFVAKTLEYLVLSEPDTRKAAARVIESALSMPQDEYGRRPLVCIDQALEVNISRRHIIEDELQKAAIAASQQTLDGKFKAEFESLVLFLAQGGDSFLGLNGMSAHNKVLREQISDRLGSRIKEFGRGSFEHAELAIAAAPEIFPEMHKQFGEAIILGASGPGVTRLQLPFLVEALLVYDRSGTSPRELLMHSIAEDFLDRVRRRRGPLLLPRDMQSFLQLPRNSVVHRLGTQPVPIDEGISRAVVYLLCAELRYLGKEEAAETVPRTIRNRIRLETQEINRRNAKLAELVGAWRDGTISLVRLVSGPQ